MLRLEPLEDRTAPALLRLVPDPGGVTSFGTAGTDANNPSQTNSQFVTTAELTVPFGPRTFGAVTNPIAASSTLTTTANAPTGLFTTLPGGTVGSTVVFDVQSTLNKPVGLNGGGTTIYTYGLDPNVILAPLTYEIVAQGNEVAGQQVTVSFGYRISGTTPQTQSGGLRQDGGFTVAGARSSLFSRNVSANEQAPTLTGGRDVFLKIGDRFQVDFTQSETAAGINATSAAAQTVLGMTLSTPLEGAGVAGVGAGAAVKLYNDNGSVAQSFFAFEESFTGGVRVASADMNNDGTPDVIAGTGPGRATLVRIFDGKTGAAIGTIEPFEAAFTGGVYVAAGDINQDGFAEIAVSPDEGGGPRVRVFNGNGLGPLVDFLGIDDTNFRGGARVAFGDLTGDARPELVVAAGFGGGPRVAVFTGPSVAGGSPVRAFNDFFVFEQTLRNGVFVAAGDLDGSGVGDLIVGGGPGGAPRVLALSGPELAAGQFVTVANFFAGDANSRSGVRVGVTDLDGDLRADLLTGSGTASRVTAYRGRDIGPLSSAPLAFRDFEAFPGTSGGVFVG